MPPTPTTVAATSVSGPQDSRGCAPAGEANNESATQTPPARNAWSLRVVSIAVPRRPEPWLVTHSALVSDGPETSAACGRLSGLRLPCQFLA